MFVARNDAFSPVTLAPYETLVTFTQGGVGVGVGVGVGFVIVIIIIVIFTITLYKLDHRLLKLLSLLSL